MFKSINTACLFFLFFFFFNQVNLTTVVFHQMFFTHAVNKMTVKLDFHRLYQVLPINFSLEGVIPCHTCLWTIALYIEVATVQSVRSVRGRVNLPHTITLTHFNMLAPGDFTTYRSKRGGVGNAHWAEISVLQSFIWKIRAGVPRSALLSVLRWSGVSDLRATTLWFCPLLHLHTWAHVY